MTKKTKKVQKELGKAVSTKGSEKLVAQAKAALAALDDESWRDALERLAALQGAIAKPGEGLRAWIGRRLEYVDEEVGFLFEDAAEDEDLGRAEKHRAILALFRSVDVKVGAAYVPCRDKMARWLKDHPVSTGG